MIRDIYYSLRVGFGVAVSHFRRLRYLRQGWRNPDDCPF